MGLPLSVYSGNYTPGAATALHAAVDLINESWAQANAKNTDFSNKIDAITDQSTGWLSTTAAPHVTAGTVAAPSVAEPAVDIPSTQSATDVMSLFDTKYAELVAMLAGKFTEFRTTYFPDDSTTFGAAQTWIANAIANPDGGIPETVLAQLLADDQARIYGEANRAIDDTLTRFAALRFPLPPGAAAAAVVEINEKAQDLTAETSRKMALASIDNMKFAIEKAIGLRQLAMGTAIDYVKAIASAPEMASQLVGVGYDAQSKLISAASQFYNARTAVAELTAKVGEFNVTTTLDAATKNQAADLTLIEDRLKALLTECQALAQMATSLYNNLNASAGTSYSVNGT